MTTPTPVPSQTLRNRLYELYDNDPDQTDDAAEGDIVAAVDPNTTPAATPHLSHATGLNASSNYRYDPLGQLTHDSREGIENIDWTVAGKVNSVTYANTSPRDPLFFTYGAGGHRIQKQVGSAPNTGVGYREHYIRDAQGNIMAIYRYSNVPNAGVSLKVKERPVYGSSRIGSYAREREMYGLDLLVQPTTYVNIVAPMLASKQQYELTDHLGNITAVVTAQLLPGNGAGSAWQPALLSAQGYEPFGALLPGRKFDVLHAIPIFKLHRMLLVGETVELDLGGTTVVLASYNAAYTTVGEYLVDIQSALSTNGITGTNANGAIQIGNWRASAILTSPSELASMTTTSSYRFGFNGQEKDDEVYGATGTSNTAEFWQYDTRSGRRWNLDPVVKPWQSSYSTFSGNPISRIDPNGDDDFFDRSGKYIGSTTTGNLIRVVSADIPFAAVEKNVERNSHVLTMLPFCPDDRASLSMLQAITLFYTPRAGISTDVIDFSWSNSDEGTPAAYYKPATDAFGLEINGQTGRLNEGMSDINNFVNSFAHEKNHQDDRTTGRPLYHVKSIIAQANHESFAGTTTGFKHAAGSYASRLLNQALSEGSPVESVSDMINAFNNSPAGEHSVLWYDTENSTVSSINMLQEFEIIQEKK